MANRVSTSRVSAPRWYTPYSESPVLVRRIAREEQPISWGMAAVTGIFGFLVMSAFLNIFYMMGYSSFSMEDYLGSLVRGSPYGTANWTYGFFLNWIFGAFFGVGYALIFENVFKAANTRIGALVGLLHAAFAAIAFFPLFNAIHGLLNIDLYPRGFGILGSRLGGFTPFLIVAAHVLFGATIGTFYGPVRAGRLQAKVSEPGDSGLPGEHDVITEEDDPVDRVVV